jgi:hypothetical protein
MSLGKQRLGDISILGLTRWRPWNLLSQKSSLPHVMQFVSDAEHNKIYQVASAPITAVAIPPIHATFPMRALRTEFIAAASGGFGPWRSSGNRRCR